MALAGIVMAGLREGRRERKVESLAVLPLENLSHDAEQEYFADGMTDELITDLAKIGALRVVSRTSVTRYKGTKKTVPEIAHELNVDAVLEGTVTRDGERVRITAQLIQADPEKHLWAEKYEATIGEVLNVQDAVAKSVAREIRVKLSPQDEKRLEVHAISPEAHEAYLKGRYFWEQSGEANLIKSRDYFQLAIDEEPGYAAAWAGLASSYNRLASWGVMARATSSPKAKAAAEKAMELDGSLVEPYVALAEEKANYEWDWAGAEHVYRKAIDLSPGYGEAHHEYATYLAAAGRMQEAVSEARRARDAEPLSGVYDANVVWKLYAARKYEEAETENRKMLGWNEREADGYITASLYLATGRQREAVDMLRKGAAGPSPGLIELMFLGHALGATGARAEGQKVLNRLLELRQRRNVPSQYIALVFEGLGERAKALEWFEKAYSERSMNIWFLPDPRLDGIRKEPRYYKIMRGMGIER
jgi:TolB-like protein